MPKKYYLFLFLSLLLSLGVITGCGYTQKSLLPEHIKSIHIRPFTNSIDLSQEITSKSRFTTYRPGLELELTNAVIDRFIFDGNLKVVPEEKADAVVQAQLTGYRRDVLRFAGENEPTEYRLSVIVDISVTDRHEDKALWHEANLVGDTTYYLSGPLARTEDEAVAEAIEDLARRVVEKTLEVW